MDFNVRLMAAYADTDQMGFVHHSNYLKYLENARWEAFRTMGLTYKKIEDEGILMPVIDINLRFFKPIYYDDEILIKMHFKLISPTKLNIEYKVFNDSDQLIHSANTLLAFLNKANKRPCRIPEFIKEIITVQPHFN